MPARRLAGAPSWRAASPRPGWPRARPAPTTSCGRRCPSAGLALVVGRDGTAYRARERRQVAALARIVDTRFREIVRYSSMTNHPSVVAGGDPMHLPYDPRPVGPVRPTPKPGPDARSGSPMSAWRQPLGGVRLERAAQTGDLAAVGPVRRPASASAPPPAAHAAVGRGELGRASTLGSKVASSCQLAVISAGLEPTRPRPGRPGRRRPARWSPGRPGATPGTPRWSAWSCSSRSLAAAPPSALSARDRVARGRAHGVDDVARLEARSPRARLGRAGPGRCPG